MKVDVDVVATSDGRRDEVGEEREVALRQSRPGRKIGNLEVPGRRRWKETGMVVVVVVWRKLQRRRSR